MWAEGRAGGWWLPLHRAPPHRLGPAGTAAPDSSPSPAPVPPPPRPAPAAPGHAPWTTPGLPPEPVPGPAPSAPPRPPLGPRPTTDCSKLLPLPGPAPPRPRPRVLVGLLQKLLPAPPRPRPRPHQGQGHRLLPSPRPRPSPTSGPTQARPPGPPGGCITNSSLPPPPRPLPSPALAPPYPVPSPPPAPRPTWDCCTKDSRPCTAPAAAVAGAPVLRGRKQSPAQGLRRSPGSAPRLSAASVVMDCLGVGWGAHGATGRSTVPPTVLPGLRPRPHSPRPGPCSSVLRAQGQELLPRLGRLAARRSGSASSGVGHRDAEMETAMSEEGRGHRAWWGRGVGRAGSGRAGEGSGRAGVLDPGLGVWSPWCAGV